MNLETEKCINKYMWMGINFFVTKQYFYVLYDTMFVTWNVFFDLCWTWAAFYSEDAIIVVNRPTIFDHFITWRNLHTHQQVWYTLERYAQRPNWQGENLKSKLIFFLHINIIYYNRIICIRTSVIIQTNKKRNVRKPSWKNAIHKYIINGVIQFDFREFFFLLLVGFFTI